MSHKRSNKQRMNNACDFNAPTGVDNLAHDPYAPRGAALGFGAPNTLP